MLSHALSRLNYANVAASLALFVALGGTGYAALNLPRDSVGARELRAGAVRHEELSRNAVRSNNVSDGSLGLHDLSSTAREALTGQRGPAGERGAPGAAGIQGSPGPPGQNAIALWALVDSFGGKAGGTAISTSHAAEGEYVVTFERSVAGCAYVATLARVVGGLTVDPPPGRITVAQDGAGVRVRTYFTNADPEDIGFHLIVVC
jgi:hypothetical protein